jgi:hypothetical protein
MYRFKPSHPNGDRPRKRIPYAGAIATLALVVALGGGTAWAAHHYLITSTHQIKPSVRNALRGDRGYTGKTGAKGSKGPKGATGATGVTGASGMASVVEVVASGKIAAASSGSGTVTCPAGLRATGGGGFDGGDATAVLYQDGPVPNTGTPATPTGWEASWKTNADAVTWSVYAVCASP